MMDRKDRLKVLSPDKVQGSSLYVYKQSLMFTTSAVLSTTSYMSYAMSFERLAGGD